MEIKELVKRVVIAKPVASRPSCCRFRSFTELLAGAIHDSSSAIRPKTVRFKSAVVNSAILSQDELYEPTMIFKPLPKVVSRSTLSVLASMGHFNITHEQTVAQFDAGDKHSSPRNPPHGAIEVPKTEQEMKDKKEAKDVANCIANVDRPSYDGYNWRKYGQKQVKGSEYPRSYYKCTHPNCPVKKMVERSYDGQIAEIVYKGEHNHLKPMPPKRSSSGQGLHSKDSNLQESSSNSARNEGQIEAEFSNTVVWPGKDQAVSCDSTKMRKKKDDYETTENSGGRIGSNGEGNKGLQCDEDGHRGKRRKLDEHNEAGTSNQGTKEARILVQNNTEPEITGDGFRWRKYGQKVVKGNSYPRSYYRCTSLKCNVRKHVEKTSDDPSAFITTYEGKHNHEMPTINMKSF